MNLLLLISSGLAVIFVLGVLCGASWAEQIMGDRERRQAATQRSLNQQFRELRQRQEAAEEAELRVRR